jgi:GST-like protein
MSETYRLLGRGCGSFIVEAAFRLAEGSYEYEEVDYDEPGPARERLFALNPVGAGARPSFSRTAP